MRKTHTEIHLRNEPKHGHKEYKYLYQQMLKDDVIRKAYKKLRKGKTKRKEIQYIDAHLDPKHKAGGSGRPTPGTGIQAKEKNPEDHLRTWEKTKNLYAGNS